MLVKVKEDVIHNIVDDESYSKSTSNTSSYQLQDTYTLAYTWKVFIKFGVKSASSSSPHAKVKIENNWETVQEIVNKSTTVNYYTVSFDGKTDDIVKIYLMSGTSNNAAQINGLRFDIISYWNATPYSTLYPQKLAEIWVQTQATLYGKHNKDIYKGGLMLNKDTSAHTWNIAPWNFVGYIRVLIEWEYVKIPYYSD